MNFATEVKGLSDRAHATEELHLIRELLHAPRGVAGYVQAVVGVSKDVSMYVLSRATHRWNNFRSMMPSFTARASRSFHTFTAASSTAVSSVWILSY
jgi:hypothetical protein